jgi:release factor glutamine methyltransferase
VPSVGEVLSGATTRLREAGSETPRLDAEVLLADVLGTDRTRLVAHPETSIGDGLGERFEAALQRRVAGEPVAYIRGIKEFFGLAFATDQRALIPRPETERLVEAGREEIMDRLAAFARRRGIAPGFVPDPIRVADIGTGSGAVAVALAVELRRIGVIAGTDVTILATDDSPEALELARENAAGHAAAEGMRFVEADLLPPVLPDDGTPLDIVLANLPYVRTEAIAGLPVAASFEPRSALDGGKDGLDVIRRLLAVLPRVLAPDGVALLEIGADQGTAAPEAVGVELPGWRASIETDLAGLPRILRVERAGEPSRADEPS